ncbi:hypothetical protein HC024_22105 [Methylococcaceae bacterium WWC4]|nr:hypothetical protein [Methylococcaceae bacterium WWC4]
MRHLLLTVLLAFGPIALGRAFVPADDDRVLEVLPERGGDLQLRALREQLRATPDDRALALQLVERYIALGRAEADPRYFGRAEAVLVPLVRSNPSAEMLTLRAVLAQNRHDFSAALADLRRALALRPRLAGAWLTQAAIHQVQGRYPEALQSCLTVSRLAADLAGRVCVESVLADSGQLEPAYRRLAGLLSVVGPESAEERQWAWTVLAEMAERLGDAEAAERHYRRALAIGRLSAYPLAGFADFLLDRQRYAEVLELLTGEQRADGLLLRLALAERQLGHSEAEGHRRTLAARFADSRRRGDTSHQGDEARFELQLNSEPEQALALAAANWQVQREPRDARILLEAAIAAGKFEAARDVLTFLAETGLEDARLRDLAARVAGRLA